MSYIFKVTRREFLKQSGIGTGALVLGCAISPSLVASPSLIDELLHGFPVKGVAFVKFKLNGNVVIIAHRSEMGQGTRSSLAAVLADELEANWDRVSVQQADADAYNFGVPCPIPMPGSPAIVKGEDAQFVDSSRSIAAYYMAMRLFGAGIRRGFEHAAAKKWGVDPSTCKGQNHRVVHLPSGRSTDYRHLLLAAGKLPQPTTDEVKLALKPKSEWRFIGKKMPFVDAKDMVMGKAVYGADVEPGRGMLTAMIERCPVANGTVKSFDATEALKVPGVRHVTRVLPDDFVARVGAGGVGAAFIPHDGIAVLADNTWAAWQGRRALKIEWNLTSSPGAYNAQYDSVAFRGDLERSAAKPGKPVRSKGRVDDAFAGAAKLVEASYYVPHLAQTPMEPPAAVAIYENDKWEIWSPTQGPELTQHYVGLYMLVPDPMDWLIWQAEEPEQFLLKACEIEEQEKFNKMLAAALNISEKELFERRNTLKKKIRDQINVHVTLLGGGFGRKSNPDYAVEAAFLARQFPGVPVRVQWTREDDIKFSFYNAAAGQYFKAALDGSNRPTAFLQRSAFTSFFATLFPPPSPLASPAENAIRVQSRAGFHNGGEYPYGSAIELAQGLQDMPLDIEHVQIENCQAESHIRCGWMRSVANIYHAFGTSSFTDELARAAGADPKNFLLDMIGKNRVLRQADLAAQGVNCLDNNQFPVNKIVGNVGGGEVDILPGFPVDLRRLRAVVERVAAESGWDRKYGSMPKGRGLGIAAHRSFLSYVAMVIDASLNDAKELTVNEVWAAIDCGIAVNPDRVMAQMEGGINYGLSIALLGNITVKNGAVVQNNFDDYPVLRIHHTPKKINVYIQDPSPEVIKEMGGEAMPSGAGEPPTPCVAPALANAIVAAGGPRIREIPFCNTIVVH